jgi:hypothetical protein
LANGEYFLDVTLANFTDLLGTHRLDPAIFADKPARIFTSGILGNDTLNYGLFAVFPDGTVVPLPNTPVARVQIIHNSPDPTVDIYAGNEKILDDFAFRTAIPFIYVPAEQQIDLGVAPANSTSVADVIATFPVTFENRKTYVVMATGVVGGSPAFDLFVNENGRERAANSADVDVAFFNGAPDVPEADAFLPGSISIENVAFGAFSGYESLLPTNDFLQVSPASNVVLTYFSNFGGLGGQAVTLFTTGFLDAGQPGFEVWVAEADGDTYPLQLYVKTNELDDKISDLQLSPNPTVADLFVRFNLLENENLRYGMRDATGRLALQGDFGTVSAGEFVQKLEVGILPAGMYQLEIVSDAGVKAVKFVVQK